MASGRGQRFGGNKLLADFCAKPLISYILGCTAPFSCLSRLVVTRSLQTATLCREKGVAVLCHQLPGRNDTIRLGLAHLLAAANPTDHPPCPEVRPGLEPAPSRLSGCLFCPADQPLLRPESIKALLLAFSGNPDRICRLGYGGQAASPVLFGSRFFPELLRLPQGAGGSYLAKKYPAQVLIVPAQDPCELYDIDTPEALTLLEHQCSFDSGLS